MRWKGQTDVSPMKADRSGINGNISNFGTV